MYMYDICTYIVHVLVTVIHVDIIIPVIHVHVHVYTSDVLCIIIM